MLPSISSAKKGGGVTQLGSKEHLLSPETTPHKSPLFLLALYAFLPAELTDYVTNNEFWVKFWHLWKNIVKLNRSSIMFILAMVLILFQIVVILLGRLHFWGCTYFQGCPHFSIPHPPLQMFLTPSLSTQSNCQKKITRRTTGARGCYFQTSVYQVR